MPVFPVLTILPLSATILAGAFAIVLLNRYATTRRRPHELMWGIAFVLFALGAACQVYADVSGSWTDLAARTYYLTGAILNVAFLAVGTIYLLFSRRTAGAALVVTLIFSVISLYVLYTTPVTASALVRTREVIDWREVFTVDATPRLLAALGSGVGTVVLIAGALWSGIIFARKKIMKSRMIGVFLIAGGTFLVAVGGTVKGALHNDNYLYPTMVLGLVFMFAGYLQTIRPANNQLRVRNYEVQA